MQGVRKENYKRYTGRHELKREQNRDTDAGLVPESNISDVGIGDERLVRRLVEAASEKLGGIFRYTSREENERYTDEPICTSQSLVMMQLRPCKVCCKYSPSAITQTQW